jgi:hypothetical protein
LVGSLRRAAFLWSSGAERWNRCETVADLLTQAVLRRSLPVQAVLQVMDISSSSADTTMMEAGGVTRHTGQRTLNMVVTVVIVTVTATGTVTKTGNAVITTGPTTIITMVGTVAIVAVATTLTQTGHPKAATTVEGLTRDTSPTAGARNTEAAARATASPTSGTGTLLRVWKNPRFVGTPDENDDSLEEKLRLEGFAVMVPNFRIAYNQSAQYHYIF